jgi:hypothetical protein
MSKAVDVDVDGVTAQAETEQDLQPVIDELQRLGVVTS